MSALGPRREAPSYPQRNSVRKLPRLLPGSVLICMGLLPQTKIFSAGWIEEKSVWVDVVSNPIVPDGSVGCVTPITRRGVSLRLV